MLFCSLNPFYDLTFLKKPYHKKLVWVFCICLLVFFDQKELCWLDSLRIYFIFFCFFNRCTCQVLLYTFWDFLYNFQSSHMIINAFSLCIIDKLLIFSGIKTKVFQFCILTCLVLFAGEKIFQYDFTLNLNERFGWFWVERSWN